MKNILILTYWSYPDALIQTYTLPYVRIIRNNLPAGSLIYLLTLEKDKTIFESDRHDAIAAELEEEGIHWLPFSYRSFGMVAFLSWLGISFKLISLIVSKKISIIHCWCTPPGAIGYFLSVFLNRKLILDSYEPHAEAMIENGTWRRESIAFRLLFWLEKKQTQRATYVISATEGMREYTASKYKVDVKSFFVKPACVDLNLFNEGVIRNQQLSHQLSLENKIVCVYAGKFGGIYLEDEIFDFIKVACNHWGDAFRFLILTNHSRSEIEVYCKRASVSLNCIIMSFVSHDRVPLYMGLADFAITPVKPIPTKQYCTPIKDGEYWALGLPVVISANISDDSQIIEANDIGVVLKSFNTEEYHRAVLEIERLLKQPGLKTRIRSIAKKYRSFDIATSVYRRIYSEHE